VDQPTSAPAGSNMRQLARGVLHNVSLPVQLNQLTSETPSMDADELNDRKASVSSSSSGNNNTNHLKRGEVYV
jgi:hypothetical protein